MGCKFHGCAGSHIARGYCESHYRQYRKGVSLSPVKRIPKTEPERFWAKVTKTETCWVWKSPEPVTGYGRFWGTWRGEPAYVGAHRYSYELHVGPIPDGLVIDHLCRNRACVNPSHLEPVTMGENVDRGISPIALNLAKTHCPRGHEYNSDNTYMTPKGARDCRTCRADAARRYREKKVGAIHV